MDCRRRENPPLCLATDYLIRNSALRAPQRFLPTSFVRTLYALNLHNSKHHDLVVIDKYVDLCMLLTFRCGIRNVYAHNQLHALHKLHVTRILARRVVYTIATSTRIDNAHARRQTNSFIEYQLVNECTNRGCNREQFRSDNIDCTTARRSRAHG